MTGTFLHIEQIAYEMEKGPLRSTRIKSIDGIDQTYGRHSLAPGEAITRTNAYIWAKHNNMLHRVFTLQVGDRRLQADIPLVYRRE